LQGGGDGEDGAAVERADALPGRCDQSCGNGDEGDVADEGRAADRFGVDGAKPVAVGPLAA